PHFTYLHTHTNVHFLKTPYHSLSNHPLFPAMEFSDHEKHLPKCMPLIIKHPTTNQPLPPTKIHSPTHVNFAPLTPILIKHFK
ncbi:malate:quinone oxidoreductase, partial [Paenibacillus xylanexedens]|uniref:malate:quinone oxidoreductase n=1 Tax=Paenibacillus xylanexedens TaxID=528191 RepID=UPI0011A470E2